MDKVTAAAVKEAAGQPWDSRGGVGVNDNAGEAGGGDRGRTRSCRHGRGPRTWDVPLRMTPRNGNGPAAAGEAGGTTAGTATDSGSGSGPGALDGPQDGHSV